MISLRPFQFVDLALKSEKDPGVKLNVDGTVKADWFCIATGAKVGQLLYILDLYRAQIGFPEQVKAMVREHKAWKSTMIGVEDYAYQWALGQAAWEKGLPVKPVKFPGDKVYRAQLSTPHFETGRVKLRGVTENGHLIPHPALKRFTREAIDFPFGDHDDTVDAIVGLVLMLMSDEFAGAEFKGVVQPGFSIVTMGGKRRRGDPYDIFPSNF